MSETGRKVISLRGDISSSRGGSDEATKIFTRRQPISPQGVSQDLHKEAAISPRGDSTAKFSTRRHLISPGGGKYEKSVMTIN